MCQLDFAKLKRNFEQTVFNKNLLEGFSSPSEMIRFKQYVNKKRTYDFIVDGLNVSLLADKGNILAQAKLVGVKLRKNHFSDTLLKCRLSHYVFRLKKKKSLSAFRCTQRIGLQTTESPYHWSETYGKMATT